MTTNLAENTSVETYAFQAEINQLLNLIIHTFYSNKDIFLRELVSNASDAIDKIRYQSLTDANVLGVNSDLHIKIKANKEAKSLTLVDTGVGMTKQDLINNLGTIARSGTRAFMESILSGGSNSDTKQMMQLIGQFGVGFYAAYLVSDHVRVVSKHNDDSLAWVWESSAGGSFTIAPATDEEAAVLGGRGTSITLMLKEDQLVYLEEGRIRSIIKQHCEFISYPILLFTTREEQVEEEAEAEAESNTEGEPKEEADEETDEEGKVEDVDLQKEKEKEKVKKTIRKEEWSTLNKQKPIWLKPSEEVTPEEYASFYKSLCNDWEDHLAVKHFSVEGQVSFRSILYVPRRAPFDIFDTRSGKGKGNIKLYVRRVFITDTATVAQSASASQDAFSGSPDAREDSFLMPEYLNFVRGIVDSDDLPLNISREMLQQNKIIRSIRKSLVKKTLDLLADLMENKPDDYKVFYENFSKSIKLGVHEDDTHRDKLSKMLLFATSRTASDDAKDLVSLKTYVDRMKETQKSIYYITGESRKAVERSPFLEKLKRKGYEVLFLTDPLDEYMMQRFHEFDGKKFVCCTKEGFKLEDNEDPESEAAKEAAAKRADLEKEFDPLCKKIKDTLGNRVVKVTLSDRIDKAPCILVTEQYSWSANMERIMKAQALQSGGAANPFAMMGSRKILEINPEHALMQYLKNLASASPNSPEHRRLTNIIEVVYESTLIHSGFSLEDPAQYTDRVFKILQAGLGMEVELEENEDDPIGAQPAPSGTAGTSETDADADADANPQSLMEEVD